MEDWEGEEVWIDEEEWVEPRDAAIHEAGHAVTAELLYLNPEYVAIEVGEIISGKMQRSPRIVGPVQEWRDSICHAAGIVAESIHFNARWLQVRLRLKDQEGDDATQLWNQITKRGGDEKRHGEWYGMIVKQTERILKSRPVWRAVTDLAERLRTEGTIERDGISETVSAALGRSKWEHDRFGMGLRHAAAPENWIQLSDWQVFMADSPSAKKRASNRSAAKKALKKMRQGDATK